MISGEKMLEIENVLTSKTQDVKKTGTIGDLTGQRNTYETNIIDSQKRELGSTFK